MLAQSEIEFIKEKKFNQDFLSGFCSTAPSYGTPGTWTRVVLHQT